MGKPWAGSGKDWPPWPFACPHSIGTLSPLPLAGEVEWPHRPLQADLHGDAVAADEQDRLRHHEPRWQPHQTGRAVQRLQRAGRGWGATLGDHPAAGISVPRGTATVRFQSAFRRAGNEEEVPGGFGGTASCVRPKAWLASPAPCFLHSQPVVLVGSPQAGRQRPQALGRVRRIDIVAVSSLSSMTLPEPPSAPLKLGAVALSCGKEFHK